MDVAVIGIDLGKNSCSLAGMDSAGRVVFRRRVSRSGLPGVVGRHPGCIVAMEARFAGRITSAGSSREPGTRCD